VRSPGCRPRHLCPPTCLPAAQHAMRPGGGSVMPLGSTGEAGRRAFHGERQVTKPRRFSSCSTGWLPASHCRPA
jgi:hypothetical protein